MSNSFNFLNFGDIKPSGWLFDQINNDLEHGFVGNLDKLVPDLIIEDDIYDKNRLSNNIKSKDVGAIIGTDEFLSQLLWWNSETQSNWWDGLSKSALLTENKKYIKKLDTYIEKILSSQDEDGYLGIYAKDLRFNFTNENGELWAQSSLFRVLLGYYEATKDERVLSSVKRAMNITMKRYPINNSTPFNIIDSSAGICHGLTIVDSLEKLYQITKNKSYLDYAVWLYEDYCKHVLSEEDIQLNNLLNDNFKFKGHAVHTYELLRALVIAYYHTSEDKFKIALEKYLNRLTKYLTPSGGPIGDEWISENGADATMTGYEYCSIHELLDSYALLLQRTKDMKYADNIEWLLFNAAQGSRHPKESSIAYLKTDNSYSMMGNFQQEQPHTKFKLQTRYQYSPTHKEAAVCCVPNAGRIYPYYVKSMWLNDNNNLICAMYGPCKIDTIINNVHVHIEEITNYPFDMGSKFKVVVDSPVQFSISLRIPSWSKSISLEADDFDIVIKNNIAILNKKWEGNNEFNIKFNPYIKQHIFNDNECFISRGPLLYSLPINHEEHIVKNFNIKNFRDLQYSNIDPIPYYLVCKDDSINSFKFKNSFNNSTWKNNNLKLVGKLYDISSNSYKEVSLVPIGSTILRKTTFELYKGI